MIKLFSLSVGKWVLDITGIMSANRIQYYMCDLVVELPTPSIDIEGHIGYTKDTKRLWFCDGSAWRQIRY